MGFSGALSSLLTTGTQAAGAYEGARKDARDAGTADLMKTLQLLRQKRQDEDAQALHAAQIRNYDEKPIVKTPRKIIQRDDGSYVSANEETGEATPVTTEAPEMQSMPDVPFEAGVGAPQEPSGRKIRVPVKGKIEPKNPVVGSPEWEKAKRFEASLHPQGEQPLVQVDTPDGPRFMTRQQALGQRPYIRNGAQGTSGQGQNMQARLLAAVSEGRLADERMDAFTKKRMKNGQLDVGSFDQIRGNAATNLASSHKPLDIVIQGLAEGSANQSDPDYMQFLRDARLISRAEQLMSARGGSEAMANDNAFLARGGAHAPQSTVDAASKTRKAMFGKLGAVIQTLTPEQQAKLARGLEALSQDDPNFDYAGVGKEIFGGATGAHGTGSTGNINLGGDQEQSPAVRRAIETLRSGRGTLAQLEAASSLTPGEKAAVRRAVGKE